VHKRVLVCVCVCLSTIRRMNEGLLQTSKHTFSDWLKPEISNLIAITRTSSLGLMMVMTIINYLLSNMSAHAQYRRRADILDNKHNKEREWGSNNSNSNTLCARNKKKNKNNTTSSSVEENKTAIALTTKSLSYTDTLTFFLLLRSSYCCCPKERNNKSALNWFTLLLLLLIGSASLF
jgi:hypothetical protein